MKVSSNAARLVSQVLAGEVWPALADRHGFRVGPDGQPFSLPGMGGVRIEDTLVVRSGAGRAAPRDLLTTTKTVTPGELLVL